MMYICFFDSFFFFFFFQAEDGIRDLVRSRGLGDVYKRQVRDRAEVIGRKLVAMGYEAGDRIALIAETSANFVCFFVGCQYASVLPVLCVDTCLLYTSDAADDLLCVDLGGRRIIKKKKNLSISRETHSTN
eukprot:TRINITY_DN438_c0_g1_i3.p1 TRINITY_DN438_c0_g1~~TRINITY_DN438_c0_g1_i3.p1  ORF type:complete len:131 (+),score=67.53 TRINITY_DN438_c0_g1_i3:47-439(+)